MAAMATLISWPHLGSSVLTSTGTALCLPPFLPRTLHITSALRPPPLFSPDAEHLEKRQRELKFSREKASLWDTFALNVFHHRRPPPPPPPSLSAATTDGGLGGITLAHPIPEKRKKNPVCVSSVTVRNLKCWRIHPQPLTVAKEQRA